MHGLLRDGFTSIGLFLVVKTAQCVLFVLISCGVVSIRIQFYEVCVFGTLCANYYNGESGCGVVSTRIQFY